MAKLYDTGEEILIKNFFTDELTRPSSITIGLYNDSTDNLSDSGDVGDITTEPTGGSYSRQTVNFGTGDMTSSDNGNSNWEVTFDQLTFDTSDSSQTVDHYFVVINFQSEDKGDGSAQDHLLFDGGLSSTTDLSQVDTFNLDNTGTSVT